MTSSEFGKALRRLREGASPVPLGLPAGGRRRAAGLRREELALLSGISGDYVTRLEQGRATHPSRQVVESLANTLGLSMTQRAHLFVLAGLVPPGHDAVPTLVRPEVRRLLERLRSTPAAVYDAAWTLLIANRPYTALLGEQPSMVENERNTVWRILLGPPDRIRYTPQARAEFESAIVADLRATAARYPDDRDLRHLVESLRERSDRFARLWDSGVLSDYSTANKDVYHPEVGLLRLYCDIHTISDADQRLMIFSAEPGTEDAERLEAVIAAGGTASDCG